MSTEKEKIKKELDAIKNNIEKRLANKEPKTSDIVQETPKEKILKKKKRTKVAPLITKMEVEKVIPKKKIDKEKKLKEEKEAVTISATTNPKREKLKKKKKFGLIPIVIILLLIGSLAFIISLKKDLDVNKKQFEEQSRKEKIDYSEDRYFKEVPDEVEEDDLQDFAVYKDVPEVIVDNNNTNNQRDISSDEQKNIDKQISDSAENFSENSNSNNSITSDNSATKSAISSKNNSITTTVPTVNDDSTIQNNTTDTPAKETNTHEQVSNTEKKHQTSKKNKASIIYSDYLKIMGLQYKDDKFVLPKKAKKINSFKVRTKLTKSMLSDSPTDVEVMLVIKNNLGKTLKIDTKTVNFEKSKSKIMYIEFYETFNEKLKIDTEYSFSIFVDKKIIKINKKRI